MAQPAVHTVQKAQEVYTSSPYRKRSFSPVKTAREVYTSSPYGKRSDFQMAQPAVHTVHRAQEVVYTSSPYRERSFSPVQTAQEVYTSKRSSAEIAGVSPSREQWSQSLMGSRASLTGRTGTSFTHAEKLSHSSQAAFGERSDFVQTAQEPVWYESKRSSAEIAGVSPSREQWSQSLMGSR